jgi:hypothetical protein
MAENETTDCSTRPEITFRDASARDIEAIATLHADSWRRHYRGAYLDSFLDGDVVADRLAVWGQRRYWWENRRLMTAFVGANDKNSGILMRQ